MGGPHEERLPDDLDGIASRLREERARVDELELDRLKRRALAQFAAGGGRRGALRSQLAAVLASLAVVGASGGAIAIAQLDSHPNSHGGAASDQYQSPKRPKPIRKATRKSTTCARTHGKRHSTKHNRKRASEARRTNGNGRRRPHRKVKCSRTKHHAKRHGKRR
jgi:hypothetical protein